MPKFLLFAAVASLAAPALAGLSACAVPQPRYAIVPDPLATAPAAAPEAAPPVEAAALVETPPAPDAEVETPRAAPLGRVETVTLAQLPPPAAEPVSEPAAPAPAAPAPAASALAAPASSVPADATLSHVVGPGDTFFAIARRYGVGPQAVAELNGLTFASTLRLGQRIQLPAGARDRGGARPAVLAEASSPAVAQVAPVRVTVVEPEPPVVETAPSPVFPSAQPGAPAATPTATAPTRPPAASTSTPGAAAPAPAPAPMATAPPPNPASRPAPLASPAPVEAALAGRGLFVWPLRGDILSGFGPKGVGQRSDGVRISAAEGDPVRAAAAGTVVYAGDQVKGGFGKLVLIEHDNRWFTAYAHLSDIGVRMKDKIAQGQQIGRAGRTGDVGAPQLYFEVRHAPTASERARPVDPAPLLP